MLHTKFCGNRSSCSGEEDFWRVFIIYGRDGHLGHVTQMPLIYFCSPYPWRLYTKFGFDWPSGFRERMFEIVNDNGQTPDHGYTISSPLSLQLRWANNTNKQGGTSPNLWQMEIENHNRSTTLQCSVINYWGPPLTSVDGCWLFRWLRRLNVVPYTWTLS